METSKKNRTDIRTTDLYKALLQIKDTAEMERFFKDLCTPQEIRTFAERWYACKLLDEGTLSYREISAQTGASLTTITRVARFLREEPHRGYRLILDRITHKKSGRSSS
jgi:TrpR-related protein YerC/YecD